MTRLLETTLNTTSHAGARRPSPACAFLPWFLGGFVWGASVWLLEGPWFVWNHPVDLLPLIPRAQATVFFYELTGISAAFGLGLLWAGVFGERTPKTRFELMRVRWAELGPGPSEISRRLIARMYALALVVAGGLWLAFQAARDVSLRIANRDNLGLALVGVHVVVLVFGVAAYRVTQQLLTSVLERLEHLQSKRFHAPGWHVGVLVTLSVVVSAIVVAAFRQTLAALSWLPALPAVFALVVAVASVKLLPRLWPHGCRVLGGTLVALFLASGVSGALAREAHDAQYAWTDGPVARLAAEWGLFWFDWDRDAHLSGFGGSDCAVLDASVHPGAIDLPGNRVDEDCDGHDAPVRTASAPAPKPRPAPNVSTGRGAVRPNLYLITIDAFAVWTLEAYGGSREIAPGLNRFAKQSVVFENFFVQGPSTRLSLPAMFTSRFDTQIDQVLEGHFPFELAPSNRMLAEVLADGGYQTLAVIPSPYFSAEHWRGFLQGFQSVATQPAEAYASGTPHTAEAVTAAALEFLRRPRQAPIFLWVHYFDAHPPHQLPAGQTVRSNAEVDMYAAELKHLDGHLGRLLDSIVESDPNHVIVLTGDHGIAFDEPRHQVNHYGYDLSTAVLHVPLLVRSPKLERARIAQLTDALDLAPTLTALAGIAPPPTFVGHNLERLLAGVASELPDVRFAQFYLGEDALRGMDP